MQRENWIVIRSSKSNLLMVFFFNKVETFFTLSFVYFLHSRQVKTSFYYYTKTINSLWNTRILNFFPFLLLSFLPITFKAIIQTQINCFLPHFYGYANTFLTLLVCKSTLIKNLSRIITMVNIYIGISLQ